MKDQVSADLAVMGAKVAPPIAVAAGTAAGSINPQSLLVWLTIAYTLAMFATFVIKNYGEWEGWWGRRAAQFRALWKWLRDE